MSFIKAFMPASVLLIASMAQAEVNCDKVVNYKDVVACAEKRSPEVITAESEYKEKTARVDAASQWENPSLSVQSVSGTQDSEKVSETDIGLSFPIELGGKRAARKQIASVEESRAQWNFYRAKSEVRREVFLKLLRLKHIEHELALIDESLETFTKLVKQYQGRPVRSPEQEVSLTVYKIAKSEYSFKRTEYDEELSRLDAYFKITTGLTVQELKNIKLPEPTAWTVPAVQNDNLKASPLVIAYEHDVQSAKSNLDVEKSESWPTMNIGPSAKITKDAGGETQQWGFNFSMPLPVFNANGAGRTAAQLAVQSAEQKKELAMKQLAADRKIFIATFTTAIAALKDAPTEPTIENSHKKIENLIMKGLVPSSLAIEAHRSMVDFEKTRNEHEQKAMNALFNIQLIDGETVGANL
jgi:Outer membrane protein